MQLKNFIFIFLSLIKKLTFALSVSFIAYNQLLSQSIVVGYYPSWISTELPAEEIQLENITHICHAFAWPEANGDISAYSDLIYPELNQRVHDAGKKIIVSLGGWGQSDGFSPMAADADARANFIDNIIYYCEKNNYDGIDFDWEHPSSASDKANLNLLISELRQELIENEENLLITMAVPGGSWSGQWYDLAFLSDYVDWFGCMTYDFHGSWSDHAGHNSPLYPASNDYCGSIQQSMTYLNGQRGTPKSKILIGLPFYGKEFTASALYGMSTACADLKYSEIVPKIGNDWTYHWDNTSKVPYLTNSQQTRLISFDDTTSIRLKCEYAVNNQFAGVMTWSLGQDIIAGTQPLLETVGHVMKPSTKIENSNTTEITTFSLATNYPNPFNSLTIIPIQIKQEDHYKLEVFNISGSTVAVLIDEKLAPGWHYIHFAPKELPTGEYFYRLSNHQLSITGKMILTK